MEPAYDDGEDPSDAHRGEDRDRGFRRTRGEDQLEHRDRVAKATLSRAERTVATPDHQSRSLGEEEADRGQEIAIASTAERTCPDVAQR
jgi:hypothetical protein